MTRSTVTKQIEIYTTLCDAVDDLEDILNLLERNHQSTVNVNALARRNRHYKQALVAVRDLAVRALADVADDGERDDA